MRILTTTLKMIPFLCWLFTYVQSGYIQNNLLNLDVRIELQPLAWQAEILTITLSSINHLSNVYFEKIK